MKVLVAGVNTRHIACSAHRAGHQVYSLDHFGDLDLRRCAEDLWTFDDPPGDLRGVIDVLPVDFDAVVLGPGFEQERLPGHRVLNNPPDVIRRVSDKLWLARELEDLGVPHPSFYESPGEAEYPLMVKPRVGAGGYKNKIVHGPGEVEDPDEVLLQEYVEGRPASVSLISTGERAVAIAVNEQLIGLPGISRLPFAYCGNITPLDTRWESRMRRIAEDLAVDLGLVGSNGVDFILTPRGPVVIEVNARFQGSLDTIELATGFNVFKAHLEAFDGVLPRAPRPQGYACKILAYTDHELRVACPPDYEGVVDVSPRGRRVEANDPIATALTHAPTRDEALEECMGLVHKIRATAEGREI